MARRGTDNYWAKYLDLMKWLNPLPPRDISEIGLTMASLDAMALAGEGPYEVVDMQPQDDGTFIVQLRHLESQMIENFTADPSANPEPEPEPEPVFELKEDLEGEPLEDVSKLLKQLEDADGT